jgi:hypothetical protein
VSVRWRPPLSGGDCYSLGYSAAREPVVSDCCHTLSKSVGVGSLQFKRVRDLGRLSSMVRAGRIRT